MQLNQSQGEMYISLDRIIGAPPSWGLNPNTPTKSAALATGSAVSSLVPPEQSQPVTGSSATPTGLSTRAGSTGRAKRSCRRKAS